MSGKDLSEMPLDEILTKRRALRRTLTSRDNLQAVRVAVLGGSTTNELVDLLELWLLWEGFKPTFHQSEYGRFYVEAVHDSASLQEFKPDIVYIHTSINDLRAFPELRSSPESFQSSVEVEIHRFEEIWTSLEEKLGCVVIQNNFEFPQRSILGNLDASSTGGRTHFVSELNRRFVMAASSRSKLFIQDVCSIAAQVGLNNWFAPERWFSYKIWTTEEGSNAIALSLTAIIRALYGKARKVLVLDLDNTIWGGVIGDDGVDNLQIGRETPLAEAYTAFQEYCLSLRNRGILLAVCSKNNEDVAKSGFEHPDSILKLDHISSFKANWNPKHENIEAIARELNLGTDSLVFIDDNPAERAIVKGQVAGIAVPNVGSDVVQYARIIDAGRYFEQIAFSKEDLERSALYQENAQRAVFETQFGDYGQYLASLAMVAEIDLFKPVYLDRIAQLTNKTNQFNLTTKRYNVGQIESAMSNPDIIGLYGKLSDRFGDNGLISVVLGHREGDNLNIDLWLMSCRVLKRDMEVAMLDAVAARASQVGIRTLTGLYIPTKKNGMVADHYSDLGFKEVSRSSDGTKIYTLNVKDYLPRNVHITVKT